MAEKYWWESEEQSGDDQGYWWENDSIATTASKNIVNRVNTWLNNHKNFVSNYQSRNAGRKYNYEDSYVSDSGKWLETVSQQKSNFDAEADSILSYMDQFGSYLDADWAKSIRETLTGARSQQNLVLESTAKDNEWWSNFKDETEYQTAVRYDGYSKKYTGKKYDDIQQAFSILEDGEEKDWLAYYQYDLYQGDSNYTSKATSGFKSYEAQKVAEIEQKKNRPWYEEVIASNPFGSDTSLPAAMISQQVTNYRNDTTYREPNDKWSDGERRQFGYLYAEDPEKAYAYAEQVNNQINAEEKYLQMQAISKGATDNFWSGAGYTLGAVSSVPLGMGIADYIDNLAEYVGRGTITQKEYLTPSEYFTAGQSAIADKFNGMDENGVAQNVLNEDLWMIGGKGWGDVYNLGVSAAQSISVGKIFGLMSKAAGMAKPAAELFTKAASLSAFMGSAGASSIDDALSRGATPEQALNLGTIVGAAEGLSEMIGIDKLLKVGSASTFANWILGSFAQGGSELVEEGFSSSVEKVADAWIMKDKSNFNASVDEIVKKLMKADPNLTKEEATKQAKSKAFVDMLGDVAFDALGGFASGTFSAALTGGASTVWDSRKGNKANIEAVEQYGEHTDALIQEGLESDPKSESYKLAQKYQKQTQGKDGKAGKAMTGFQIRNLLAANQEQITPKDLKLIQKAAENRLTELGEHENASRVAELATKYATGQKMTRAEKRELAISDFGSRVANELMPENIESGEYTSDWAENIGTKQVNVEAYNKDAIKQVRAIIEQMANPEDPADYKSLTDRIGTEGRFGVSEGGQATIRATGEAFDFDSAEVSEVGEGQMSFKTEDGSNVYAGDIDFTDDNQSFLVSAVSEIENITPAAATEVMHKIVDMSKPLGVQLNAIDEAFTYGFNDYSVEDMKAGEFTKNLTEEQAMRAYELGQEARKTSDSSKAEGIKKMRTAAKALAEKAAAEGKEAPKAEKLAITYNHGGGKVESIDQANLKGLTEHSRAGIEMAKVLHKLGIGGNFEVFSSYLSKTMKDDKGNPLRVFLNDAGVEEAAYSGLYRKKDGTIRIDLNAYNGRGLTLNALSHELTHFIQQWSGEKYKALADFLVKTYEGTDMTMHQRVLREQARLERIRKESVSYSEAYDEVVANAMSKMLDDGKLVERLTELREQDKGLAQKLWEGFKKILSKFFKLYEQESALFHDAADLMEMKEAFEKLQAMFAEALVDASDNFQASLIAKEAGLDIMPVEDGTQFSYSSLAEAAGFVAVQNDDGARSFVRDGQAVSEVTVEDIENSPIGAFINFSVEMKDISEADAKCQKEMFAQICTMACKTNDFAMTMQFVGSAVFTGMKANADKQYGTTYDFPSICTKTQAVIDAMSAKMMSLGRGLKTDEIVKLYDDVFASGNPVPCPECYVFSRWIGIGGLLDNIKKYQDYYGDMDIEDVADAYRKMKAEVSKFADEQGISFGKAKGALTSKLTKEYNKLNEKIEKAQNQGEKVKPADLKRLQELEPMMNTVKAMTWLENVYFADSSLKKVNPKFRVPNDVLFDLNNGEAFASQYKDAWAFRTTQGAGYGKAITPYAEARLGEGVLVTNNTTNAIKGRAQGTLNNYFLSQKGKLDKQSREALKKARLKQKIQAFIGGQRFQSTSDARYENASDYLLAALEMQAMGGMVQCYTKVDGAVPAFAAWGFSINQSLMPLNGGLDADGNVKDTAVGGMKPSVAFDNRDRHETAGTITIGVNDNHIRAMFNQWVRDFIIPYHASGGKADVVAEFRRIQEGKEAKGKAVRSTDYSRTQSDKVLSDEVLRWQGKTDAQIQRIHEIRNARIAILTGGKPNMTVVRSNRFLSALYDKLNKGGEWDGVKLAKSKVESQIFPNEFWDQTVTYEESAKITKDYLGYCEDLGFLHRFSGTVPSNGRLVPVNGYDQNGNRVQLTNLAYKYDENGNKTDEVEPFFWKVLTDRRMYDNSGNYLPQKVVTLNDTTEDTVTGFAKNNQGRQYDKAKAEALAQKILTGEQYSSQETDLDRITLSMTDEERTAILNKKSVIAGVYDGQAADAIKRNKADLDSGKIGLVKSALVRIGDEFGIFTGYDIADVDVKIQLSKGNIKESVSKDISPVRIAKLLPVLKTAVENAIGIESHANRYFYDNTTVYFENLLGGYVDGEYFVPVRFGLKHSTTGEATLYVIVDQQPVESKKIKAEVVKIPDAQGVRAAISRSAFKVSVANLARFVNGKDLLRYLPDNMLSDEQIKTKWEGIAETIKKTNAKNDEKYAKFIAEGNLNAAQRMVDQAASEAFRSSVLRDKNGKLIKVYHGSHEKFNVFRGKEIGGVGNYFSPWQSFAAGYGDTRAFYLNLTDPVIYDYDWNQVNDIQEDKADGFIYVPEDMEGGIDQNKVGDTEIVVYDSNRIKSADPVTYDDNGNVIPLSERFNAEKKDIRYSSQETDADYIRYDRRAILKESKVDEYLYDYAAKSSPKYAQAYIAYVRPRTFLKLTTDDVFERYHIADQAGKLDEERLSDSRPGIYLRIDHETGQVTGHEGRHRMSAMDGVGIELVPVLLLDTSNKMTKTDIAEITLHGQFDETAMGIVKDLIPLNYENRDRVIKNFATQSSTQRIGERYGLNKTLRFSSHDTDNVSNRHLLANAFEGISQNSVEYKMIQDYKGHIKELNELETKLDRLNAEIRKIRFGTEGKRDNEKLRQLEEEAKNTAKEINRYDKRLLNMEASEPLRKVIDRERKKEAQKTKDHVKEIQQNKKVRAEQAELRHKIRKAVRDLDKILNRGNKKLNVKEDMKGFASKALELADYLFTDHISNDELIRRGITVPMRGNEPQLVKETEEILSQLYDHADSLSDEEFTRLDEKRKRNMEKLRDLLTSQRNERLNTPVYNLFNDLVTEYAGLKNSKQDAVKAAYNPEVERFLRSYIGEGADGTDSDRKVLLQNMRVADMTMDELWRLYNAYTMVLHTVRDANKLFVKGKAESVEKMAEKIIWDFGSRKTPEGKVVTVIRNLSNKLGWDYEKLYYALDRIGSEAFTELVMNIANSENIVMRDIMEAAAFRDEMVEKYDFNNWDVNKEIDREFLDNTGKKFKMTLGQLMALYAYSRRAGAWDHIEYGGFVFGEAALTNPKPADSYKLSQAQCEAITSLLTKEQKGYVEDMQKFLSETMGEKGNEVSMLLYGIKMFGEKNYFPIHVAGQFKAQANESQAKAAAGFSSMSNAGFTHAQNPNAKAPFVLEGFNEVWVDHVNEMSRYHGTVPALEDMRRVMNRSSYSEATAESMAIKQLMQNSFGKEAVEYFDNLYREANSGAITDRLQKRSKKLLSMFRKNSVAYSLSVLIQQPASMTRAYALIDKKYFGFKGVGALSSGIAKAVSDKWTKAHTNAFNEMLKYAPGVTMAKEIGGFDTATGGSIRSYLLDTNKSFRQKWKTETIAGKGAAMMDLVDNNAVANLPNVADKIAWIEIWNACKRETVAKHKDLKPGSEEFMQAVGERFTEVIRATQVYDSIFAKSPLLKSKNLAVQYLVSFMNEPNTVANMAESAVRDFMSGDKKVGVKKAAVLIHGIIFTGVLKSIVYAMRDDDEDESYIEKYIEALTGSLMDDFNALNYIPLARDVWSLAQGYDVERADMAIVADAIDALSRVIKNGFTDTEDMTEEDLIEFDKKCTEANWKLVESLAAFFGIPVKNIRREIEGVLNHARIASANKGKTTKLSVWDKISETVIDSIPFMQNKKSKQDKLYDVILSGDKGYLARLKSGYKDEDAYTSAVRKALRENDPRIHEAAMAKYEGNSEEYKRIFREIQKEGKFSFDDIMSAINSEESKIRNELEPKSESSDYSATDFVNALIVGETNLAQAMKEDIISYKVANGKAQEDAEKSFASSVSTSTRNAFDSDLLDAAGVAEILTAYADMDDEEADAKINYWAFMKEHPQHREDLSESNVEDYHEFAEPAEIPLDVFVQYVKGTSGLVTIRDEWGDEVKSKREQVLEVIDSLPLSWEQKDALYLAAGYAESKIWDVPW